MAKKHKLITFSPEIIELANNCKIDEKEVESSLNKLTQEVKAFNKFLDSRPDADEIVSRMNEEMKRQPYEDKIIEQKPWWKKLWIWS